MERELQRRFAGAARWSVGAEVAAKLVSLGVNMLLARLVAPAAYGVLATAMMVTSFADLFTDAGFQKYLIQHEFAGDGERRDAADVAFWTNLAFSLLLWGRDLPAAGPDRRVCGQPGLWRGGRARMRAAAGDGVYVRRHVAAAARARLSAAVFPAHGAERGAARGHGAAGAARPVALGAGAGHAGGARGERGGAAGQRRMAAAVVLPLRRAARDVLVLVLDAARGRFDLGVQLV